MRTNYGKKFILVALCFTLACAFACGCGSTPSSEEQENPPVEEIVELPKGFTELTYAQSTGVSTTGLGVELDPLFFTYDEDFRKNDAYFENVNVEDYWNLVSERLDTLQVTRFRCMMVPTWAEPNNDDDDPYHIEWSGYNFASREMQALCRVLDLAESKGIGVTLVSWGVPKGSFLAQGNTAQNWVVGAKGTTAIAEYCENFSAVVQWLLNEKKYTCVDWITPGNEPDWAWEIDDVHGDATAYAAMCKELDRRFEADGIRDKVKFNLGDATKNGAKRWFEAIQDELKGIADVVNTHTYEFSSRHENKEIAAWVRQNKAFADEIGADYYMGEFGSYEDGTIEKMDSFERGVGLARQMMNYFNHGVSGMSYWILFDQHYSAAPFAESMSANGLWYSYKRFYANTDYENRVHEDFAVRNHYYMYSMLSRSIGANETVYPLNIKHEFIIGTRFLRRNGKQTFALVNQTEEGMRYCFREADKSAQYEYLVYTRDAPPEGDAVIAPSNVLKAKNGYVSFIAPAESVLVIRQK